MFTGTLPPLCQKLRYEWSTRLPAPWPLAEALAAALTPDWMPTRPDIVTLNTVSNWSQLPPLMVRNPLLWLKLTDAPPRRLVTFDTWYPESRSRTALPDDGFVVTCTYWVFGSVLLIVVYPYAPLPKLPPGMPPYMNPPPSTPC